MTTTTPTLLSKTAAAYLPFNKHTFTTLSAVTAGTLLALTAITLPVAYRDYKKFLSYGPGGVPHNVFGWVVVNLMRPLTRETLSTTVYEEKIQQGETESFLVNLPAREGERPEMGSHAVPQRQMNQIPDLEVKEKLTQRYMEFVSKNPHLIKINESLLERHSPAIFLADNVPQSDIARGINSEIAHIHCTGEFSVHVTLSPADCKKVIDAGWAQRHPLSGSPLLKPASGSGKPFLSSEYVFIYAPRNDEEVGVVMKIIVASIKYMTGAKEVNY